MCCRRCGACTGGANWRGGRGGLAGGGEELCERLGFPPLALEQAAAFMAQNRASAQRYAQLLDAAPTGMFADAAEGTPLNRTLARVWAVSLDDVLADELLFRQLLQVLARLRCVIASCCDWAVGRLVVRAELIPAG